MKIDKFSTKEEEEMIEELVYRKKKKLIDNDISYYQRA